MSAPGKRDELAKIEQAIAVQEGCEACSPKRSSRRCCGLC
jgi:hypothetical protein